MTTEVFCWTLWMTIQEPLITPHVAQRRRRKHWYSKVASKVSNKTLLIYLIRIFHKSVRTKCVLFSNSVENICCLMFDPFCYESKTARVWPARSDGLFGSQSGLLVLARHNNFSVRALRGKFCFYCIFAWISIKNITRRAYIAASVASTLSHWLMAMDRRLNRASYYDRELVG